MCNENDEIESAGTFITLLRAPGIIGVSEVYRIARTTALKHCADWKLSALIGDKIRLKNVLIALNTCLFE